MKKGIIISGFGGQGVMLAGGMLCYTAIKEGKFVTFFPSYGAEIRGGSANCQVTISEKSIGSPVVTQPDILITMNKPSFDKFSKRVDSNVIIFANTSLFTPEPIENIKIIKIPANNLAEKCGSSLVVNMVMLGAAISKTNILKLETLKQTIPEVLTERKKKLWDINIKAVELGFNYINNKE